MFSSEQDDCKSKYGRRMPLAEIVNLERFGWSLSTTISLNLDPNQLIIDPAESHIP